MEGQDHKDITQKNFGVSFDYYKFSDHGLWGFKDYTDKSNNGRIKT